MRKLFSIGAALMFASAIASASVRFDPPTGNGFVGKGDVQLVYGWNNKQLQDNAASVGSSLRPSVTDCSVARGSGRTTPENRSAHLDTTTVRAWSVRSPARRNQITGFILNGYNGTATACEVHQWTAASSIRAAIQRKRVAESTTHDRRPAGLVTSTTARTAVRFSKFRPPDGRAGALLAGPFHSSRGHQ